jgi:hypothetical protein
MNYIDDFLGRKVASGELGYPRAFVSEGHFGLIIN